jgi:hypothetical protein
MNHSRRKRDFLYMLRLASRLLQLYTFPYTCTRLWSGLGTYSCTRFAALLQLHPRQFQSRWNWTFCSVIQRPIRCRTDRHHSSAALPFDQNPGILDAIGWYTYARQYMDIFVNQWLFIKIPWYWPISHYSSKQDLVDMMEQLLRLAAREFL